MWLIVLQCFVVISSISAQVTRSLSPAGGAAAGQSIRTRVLWNTVSSPLTGGPTFRYAPSSAWMNRTLTPLGAVRMDSKLRM
jgi:hypothetical protein